MSQMRAFSPTAVEAAEPRVSSSVRVWLVIVALMVALTALVGAATRLTGSGLSITEWAPIVGVVPPLNEVQWQEAFEKYKQIPQYAKNNKGMSLDQFRTIFWWEWSHRVLGRLIGVVFLVPFLFFLARGAIPSALRSRLVLLFLLGGVQGAIGWYMVRSGLVDRVDVSPYRLALHLGVALLILGLIVWTLLENGRDQVRAHLATLTVGDSWRAHVLLALVYLQILLGALVAGGKAGLTYNTWPLMDGWLWPGGLFSLSPWWVNLFENSALVQFNHRIVGYVLAILSVVHAAAVIERSDDERVRRSAGALAVVLWVQAALGIWTLLAWVPVSLGVLHQAGALVVLVVAIWHVFAVRRACLDKA